MDESLETRCRREIDELYRFFQDWFNGTIARTDANFVRLRGVVAETFSIVTPDGRKTNRLELLMALRRQHGSWREEGEPTSRIRIANVSLQHVEGDLALFSFEEWQQIRGEVKGRMSTALFRSREGTPNGVEWIHVHEVWLP